MVSSCLPPPRLFHFSLVPLNSIQSFFLRLCPASPRAKNKPSASPMLISTDVPSTGSTTPLDCDGVNEDGSQNNSQGTAFVCLEMLDLQTSRKDHPRHRPRLLRPVNPGALNQVDRV